MRAFGRKKLKEVKRILEERNLDAIILINREKLIDPNIFYFSNFLQEEGMGNAILILTKNKRILLAKEDEIREWKKKIDVEKIEEKSSEKLREYLKKLGFERIGINKEYLTVESLEYLRKIWKGKFFDVSKELKKIRAVKTNEEIKIIKKASKITNEILEFIENEILERVKKGKIKEDEIRCLIQNEMRKRKVEFSFRPLIATGKRSSQVHVNPSYSFDIAKKFGYIDFGIKFRNYKTDVTIAFDFEKNEKRKKVREILLGVYGKVLEKVEIGMKDYELFEIANNELKKFGFELKHGLGHGIGLEVHELPSFLPKNRRKDIIEIENGMVFTIEPGIYLKNFGFRIEDDFLVWKNKLIPLTNSRFVF